MLHDFKAYQLAKTYYQRCKYLRLPLFLKDQLTRSSASIVLNLAEGSGKRTRNDQRRFYSMAFGSLRESQAILDMEGISDSELKQLTDQLGAVLWKLSGYSKATSDPEPPTSDLRPPTPNSKLTP